MSPSKLMEGRPNFLTGIRVGNDLQRSGGLAWTCLNEKIGFWPDTYPGGGPHSLCA